MDEKQIARFNEAQREAFDRSFDRFLLALAPDVVERMARIVAAPSIAPGEAVLDVGTGTGALIPLIQRYRPSHVIACDLSGKMLEQVARRFPGVACHQCDVRDLTQSWKSERHAHDCGAARRSLFCFPRGCSSDSLSLRTPNQSWRVTWPNLRVAAA